MLQVIEDNMTPEQFIYWLQGFSEGRTKPPTEKEWKMIKDHLDTVFTKVTPDYTFGTTTHAPMPPFIPGDDPNPPNFVC